MTVCSLPSILSPRLRQWVGVVPLSRICQAIVTPQAIVLVNVLVILSDASIHLPSEHGDLKEE